MRRHGLFLAMVGLVTACGSNQEHSEFLGSNAASSPIFAVLGGNRSCAEYEGNPRSPYANEIYRHAAAIKRELEYDYGVGVRFVASCYTDGDPTVYYVTSEQPDTVHRSRDQDIAALTVLDMHQQQPGSIFVIGYSYGGWLSMRTASLLTQHHSLAAVATIDPISRVECNYSNPFGCQRAPRDFRQDELERISSQSRWWSNFYQNRTWYLQSSAIRQAHANQRIGATHYSIATDHQVWGHIRDLVQTYR